MGLEHSVLVPYLRPCVSVSDTTQLVIYDVIHKTKHNLKLILVSLNLYVVIQYVSCKPILLQIIHNYNTC